MINQRGRMNEIDDGDYDDIKMQEVSEEAQDEEEDAEIDLE